MPSSPSSKSKALAETISQLKASAAKCVEKRWLVASHVNVAAHESFGDPLLDLVLAPLLASSASHASVIHAGVPRKAMGIVRECSHLDSLDAIVAIGGDSLVHEIINGLLNRKDWQLAIKIPIVVIPLASTPTSPHIFQTTEKALASLFLTQKSIPSATLCKTHILACTTLSGLRIFSHSTVTADVDRVFGEEEERKGIREIFFRRRNAPHGSDVYNLAILEPPTTTTNPSKRDRSSNVQRNRSKSRGRNPSPPNQPTSAPTRRPSSSSESPTRRDPIGPQLYHFETICRLVLSPTAAVAALPACDCKLADGWTALQVAPTGERAFTCRPTATGDIDIAGSGLICGPAAVARALCLHPPKGWDPRARVARLVVDGVEFHERRGVSVEVLEDVYLTIVRMDGGAPLREDGGAAGSGIAVGGKKSVSKRGEGENWGSVIESLGWLLAVGAIVAGVAVGYRLLNRS